MNPRIRIGAPLDRRAFSTLEGQLSGLSLDRMRGRDLHRPYYGVRSIDEVSSITERCRAFQQRMPAHAFFCSLTAAAVMGIPLPLWRERAVELHVAVPSPQRALRGEGIIGHKLKFERALVTEINGIRVSNPEGTWCQLGSLLPVADVVAAGDFLIQLREPMTTLAELGRALDGYPGRRGKPTLRTAIQLLNPYAESPQESRLRVILVQGGLTDVIANLPIRTSGGHNYRADLAFPAKKVIVEYQGAHHLIAERYRSDLTRTSRLEADGWYVIQVNADDLRDPGELLRRIRRVLQTRPHFS